MIARLPALALAVAIVAAVPGCARQPNLHEPAEPVVGENFDRDELRIDVASTLLDRGDVARASDIIAQLVAEGVNDPQVTLLQGRALAADGLYSEAEPLLKVAHDRMPRDPRPLLALGLVYADTHRIDEAIASYQRATELDDRDAAAWNNLGFLLLSARRYEEARRALEQAVALDNTNARYRNNLGFALAAVGRTSDALQAFRSAGSEATAQANLGVAFELHGQPEQAVVHYRKALEIDPEQASAREGLTRLVPSREEVP